MDGRQYGLSSQGNLTDNKTYLFVKLTDSALKAIEDHVRTGVSLTNNPECVLMAGNVTQFVCSATATVRLHSITPHLKEDDVFSYPVL